MNIYYIKFIHLLNFITKMVHLYIILFGDWGLGIGDWGLGIGRVLELEKGVNSKSLLFKTLI